MQHTYTIGEVSNDKATCNNCATRLPPTDLLRLGWDVQHLLVAATGLARTFNGVVRAAVLIVVFARFG